MDGKIERTELCALRKIGLWKTRVKVLTHIHLVLCVKSVVKNLEHDQGLERMEPWSRRGSCVIGNVYISGSMSLSE